MAEIGYGIAVKVLELLGSRTLQEISSAWGFKGDLKKIGRRVLAIKAVLIDAEEKQASNERLRTWLRELKDVLIDAENVLDEFQYRVLQKDVLKINGSSRKKVRIFFSGSNPLLFRFKMANKIKGVRERLDDISALKDEFNLAAQLEDRNPTVNRRDMTHSFVPSQNVIGRDDDRNRIIHLLINQDDRRNVSVIPIVGIGGLGKTTLAKLVYNDKQVVSHFQQLRMWVCVSEDFDVTRLIKEILKSAKVPVDENLGIDQWQNSLRELLEDKKFLLVLDDVWNDDRNKWMELENLLLGGCNGSKIIVTTRNSSVATIMGSASPYNLEGLPEENCMSLFVKLAFKEGEEEQYPNLLNIGREIVKKCKGVPLAVTTLAGPLYSKVDEHEWIFIRDNEIWNLEQKEGGILPALKLSYNQLPFHLKQCFAYCSLFPKDYGFNNLVLIQFWMAHGILPSPANESQELEDVGDLYIKELLSRTFFQDVDQEENLPMYYTFKMHDLVHDLALSIAKGGCSVVTKKSTLAAEVCHLSILENGQEVTTQLEKLSKVQTIIFQTEQPTSLLEACITRFKYLRVLNLANSSFEALPCSIGSLKHLRYLDLSNNCIIEQLPYSICKLHNLQTLMLYNCSNLEQLPKGIRDIISLRFLWVTTKHTCLSEKAVDCLDSLRFLLIANCENLKCVFEGMEEGRLTNLRTLIVSECPRLTSLSLSIKHLTALENLIIADCEGLSLTDKEENQDLKLSLRLLNIENLPKLEVLPQWLQASADTLQHLEIEDCCKFTALPEWLPHLKSLQTLRIKDCPVFSSLPKGMQDLTALREIHIRNCGELSLTDKEKNQAIKSSLRLLKIGELPKLEVLPQWLKASANTLQHLEIVFCHNFTTLPEWLPHLKSLQTLRIEDCPVFSSLPKGMQDLTTLREIHIWNCGALSLTDKEENQAIKSSLRLLKIGKLPKLKVLPQWLKASANTLQHLEIVFCHNFTALPEWLPHLKSLKTLRIEGCFVFSSLPKGMQDLTALREIHIGNCKELSLTDKEENQAIKSSLRLLKIEKLIKLEVLPQWLKASANTLQHLEIEDCCNFTALPEWLPHLKSLQTLRIKYCPVFSSLPEGMQDLTALREFQIWECPKLSRKSREEVRHKIAHVPNIDFDDYFDEDSGSSSDRDDNISEYLQGEDDEEFNTSHNQ